jgi:hypothetical protein
MRVWDLLKKNAGLYIIFGPNGYKSCTIGHLLLLDGNSTIDKQFRQNISSSTLLVRITHCQALYLKQ